MNAIACWLVVLLVPVLGTVADWQIRQHQGSRSPYWSPGTTTPSPPPPSCSLVHLDLVCRHGSRYPKEPDVTDLSKLQNTVQNYTAYINETYGYIKNWTNPFILSLAGSLSLTGQEELYHMGMRFNQTNYPLFSSHYDPNVYVIQSTHVPRAGMSASSFTEGFLQGQGAIGSSHFQPRYIFSETLAYDILRFFDNCPQYGAAWNNGTINHNEADIYMNQTYPAIAARIAQTLGVAQYWQISNKDLYAMFTACAFEIAVYSKTDGWCALFTEEDIATNEYVFDLRAYWGKSYGTKFGYQIGSVVLQNVVATMDAVISGNVSMQKAYLRFAHLSTIIPLSAVLGLYRDNYVLTANLTQEQINNRTWSTRIVAPFASNLAFSLYSCGNSEFYVKLSANEVEYPIPGCNATYCPYTQFKTIYAEALAFNFTKECALPVSTVETRRFSLFVFCASVAAAFFVGVLAVLGILGTIFVINRRRSSQYSAIIKLDL